MVDRTSPTSDMSSWGWFAGWVSLGVVIGVTLELVVFLPVSALVALAVARWLPQSRDHWEGVLTGIGLPFLYVAYINRGPGDFSPWPWLAIGIALTVAGVVLHQPRVRHRPR